MMIVTEPVSINCFSLDTVDHTRRRSLIHAVFASNLSPRSPSWM